MADTLKALVAELNKKLGPGTIVLGSEIDFSSLPRIATGSLGLDVALGGGWPANQWNEIYGEFSDGKTCIVLKTIAENQRLDKEWRVAWVAAEEFVPEYAAKLGCDLDRIHVIDTNVMEVAYDTTIRFLEARCVDCVVIDSLPALVPSEESEKSMDDFQVGLAARLTGKFFRKQGPAMARSLTEPDRPVTGFMINQFREKIGVLFGDPRTTPGGKAKNFFYFSRLEVRRDEWIEVDDERVGQVMKCRTTKNKLFPPQRTATIDFYFADSPPFVAGQYDRVKEITNLAIQQRILQRRGAYYEFDGQKWQGRFALTEAVREDARMQAELEREILAATTRQPPGCRPPAPRVVKRKR